jgi:hypothetical protein
MIAYDLVVAMPGATVRGNPASEVGTVAECVFGRVTFSARWPRFCTGGENGTHAYVSRRPDTYRREIDQTTGRCRRCYQHVAPEFDPGAVTA